MKIIMVTTVVCLLTFQNVEYTLAGWDTPLTPKEYRDILGQGFATNFFKSDVPLPKYNKDNVKNVYDAGFRNLRLRCRTDLEGLLPFTGAKFTSFLNDLSAVVDNCLEYNLFPVITWIHHEAEVNVTTEGARENYIVWWEAVATHLKDKDYRLSFSLLIELDIDDCDDCSDSLRENLDIYIDWTEDVAEKIRNTSGKNADRILILGSPGKTARDLKRINDSVFDTFMMVEFHSYASGPKKIILKNGKESAKRWVGNGSVSDRENVHEAIKYATDFTKKSGIPTYLGAWMPQDKIDGALNHAEVINFARYFIWALGEAKIPWSLDVLDVYYDTRSSTWRTDEQVIPEGGTTLYMNEVLSEIVDAMLPYQP